MIKKLLATFALSATIVLPAVSANAANISSAPNRINDMSALQNGAKLFVNHCLSCHSATSMRYSKLTEIGLTDEQIENNLLFTSDKIGEVMDIAMTKEDAAKWFGSAPPDLSVTARALSENMGYSGVDYIYSFLRSFYRDASRPTGWNNLVFPNVGMPHVLWHSQGERSLERTVIKEEDQEDGSKAWVRTKSSFDEHGFSTIDKEILDNYSGDPVDNVKINSADSSQASAFDNDVADLANFLGWVAEPVQRFRKQLGIWVVFFLGIFFVVAWRLNSAYWKDVK